MKLNQAEAFSMDEEISSSLKGLLAQLADNEVMRAYKEIEEKVKDHPALYKLTEEIKSYQKEAVKFAHYGKPEAERVAIKKADELTKEFDEHPLVIRYRECLVEANDLLQHLTNLLEETVNQSLSTNYEKRVDGNS